MYQLGYWLAIIRDGHDAMQGGIDVTSGSPEHNHFINTFPEDLMLWGGPSQMDWDAEANCNRIAPPNEMPHIAYISRLNSLIENAPKSSTHDTFVLRRGDHDPEHACI